MRLSARPLLDNAADQALFVGRVDAVGQIQRSLGSSLNCLVVGPPGSGKTSLVRAVAYRSHETNAPLRFVHVRAAAAATAADLLAAVLAAVRKSAAARKSGAGATAGPAQPSALDVLDELAKAIDGLNRAEPALTLVLVVDDVLAAAGSAVFGALRDEIWELDARWLVTTSTAQVSGWVRPPADVFFETRVDLGPLTAQEAAELLRRRMDADDGPDVRSVESIVAATDAARETPRRLLESARELAAGSAVGGAGLTALAGLEARTAAIGAMSRPARMLAQELDALGWSSASDERLLARMGWTRPRVIQVMAELEDRGLVDMREESAGRGRPRKLYRLKPAGVFGNPAVPTEDEPTGRRPT